MAKPPANKNANHVNRRVKRSGKSAHAKHRQSASGRLPEVTGATAASSTTATVVLLNKPYGVVSQFSGDDKTLADLVPIKGVYPAGRLDKDSEGLLLLTNHGQLQHRISHPDKKWQKRYWVQVEGEITEEALKLLTAGVNLKDGPAKAISAQRIDPPELWPRNPPVRYRASIPDCWIELTLDEGRNRQVRRMTAAAGFPTLRLIRHSIGCWNLTNLKSGKYQTIELAGTTLSTLLV